MISYSSTAPSGWSTWRGAFRRWIAPSSLGMQASRLYGAIARQARQPQFYSTLGVPDTIDGRFDLLLLHAFMVFHALDRHGAPGKQLAQKTCDLMFRALEEGMRELGVGDMGVPRRVKAMTSAYAGRAQAYLAALSAGPTALREALRRNLYRGSEVDTGSLASVVDYVTQETRRLQTLAFERFLSAELDFAHPAGSIETNE